jgi:hypothetical protein
VIEGKALLVGAVAIAVFLLATAVLGAAVSFAAVIFLIGPHGGGILPEWSHLPVLAVLAIGVGYVSFKTARWTHITLTRRMGAV